MSVRSSFHWCFLALALGLAPREVVAQPRLGPSELARVKSLLDLYRSELSAEQYSLLSTRLAQTQQAYLELTVASGEATVVAAETGTAAELAASGGRAILSGVAEVLPLLLFVMPSTAHAPGMKDEKPQLRAARVKLEESLKELAQAARQVEAERNAGASRRPRPATQTTGSGHNQGVKCQLMGSGGGYNPSRPGKCFYECSDGRSICKLIRAPGTSCPDGAATDHYSVPISDLHNLEDCP